jgi:serine/threonine protein kinase
VLRSHKYGPPVDIFALGCIFAELYMQRPIFPGKNELDQLTVLCNILGAPNANEWEDGLHLAYKRNIKWPEGRKVRLDVLIPSASKEAIEVMEKMLLWDPAKRPTADDILGCEFFR